MAHDKTALAQKIFIIRDATLNDAHILDTNYKNLIRESQDPQEAKLFVILQNNVHRRIEKLTKETIKN